MDNIAYYIRRLWWVGVLLAVMLIVVVLAVLLSRRNAAANIEITLVPDNAKVSIDGQPSKSGKSRVSPGPHNIKAASEGFQTLAQDINVTDNLQQVVFALTPISDEAKKWAREHQEDYARAEELGGQAAAQQNKDFAARYPLVDKLPYATGFYEINYSIEDRRKNTIYIRIDSTSPMGRQVALQQIRDWGYDPTDYKIIFPGLINPLDPAEVQGE